MNKGRAVTDRITRDDGQPAHIDDIIDEAVVSNCFAHVEMMGRGSAFMTLGEHCFWIFAERSRLSIQYSERRAPSSFVPCEKAERGCLLAAGHEGLCIEPSAPRGEGGA